MLVLIGEQRHLGQKIAYGCRGGSLAQLPVHKLMDAAQQLLQVFIAVLPFLRLVHEGGGEHRGLLQYVMGKRIGVFLLRLLAEAADEGGKLHQLFGGGGRYLQLAGCGVAYDA